VVLPNEVVAAPDATGTLPISCAAKSVRHPGLAKLQGAHRRKRWCPTLCPVEPSSFASCRLLARRGSRAATVSSPLRAAALCCAVARAPPARTTPQPQPARTSPGAGTAGGGDALTPVAPRHLRSTRRHIAAAPARILASQTYARAATLMGCRPLVPGSTRRGVRVATRVRETCRSLARASRLGCVTPTARQCA
jgi:hypothetical protein